MRTLRTTATLEYEERQYTVVILFPPCGGIEYPKHAADFMWTEGNYDCDCNKSMFIQEQCDPNFQELDCGDSIRLVNLEMEYDEEDSE